MWHLRNKRGELNPQERALRDEFGLRIVYPSELFYKTHKISQKDFLEKLRQAESSDQVAKLINGLYKDKSVSGRRGVMSLKDGTGLV